MSKLRVAVVGVGHLGQHRGPRSASAQREWEDGPVDRPIAGRQTAWAAPGTAMKEVA